MENGIFFCLSFFLSFCLSHIHRNLELVEDLNKSRTNSEVESKIHFGRGNDDVTDGTRPLNRSA